MSQEEEAAPPVFAAAAASHERERKPTKDQFIGKSFSLSVFRWWSGVCINIKIKPGSIHKLCR